MWTRLFLILLLAMGGWAVPALAVEDLASKTMHNAETSTGDGLPLDVTGMSGVGLQITISATATVDFLTTVDGTTWNSHVCASVADTAQTLVTQVTATGSYQCSVSGMRQFIARVTANTGTVTVKGLSTSASARSRGGGGGGSQGSLQAAFAVGKEITGANSFANAFRISDGTTTGWAAYTDATSGPMFICFVLNIPNDCHYYRSLNPGKEGGFTDRNGTKIFTITEAVGSGALTNVTLNAESSGNTITTTTKVSFAAVGCNGTSGTLLMDTNATLAPTATCIAGSTNTTLMQGYADYPDSASDTHMMTVFRLPIDWTGAIDAVIYWKAAATSGDVVWMLQTLCRADAEIEDAAWNTTFNFPADTAKGTTLQLNTVTGTSITTTGCAAGELMYINVVRNNATSGDTIAGVVSLKNVELTLRRAQ